MNNALFATLFGSPSLAQKYDAKVLATNPIAYYKLGETSGTTAVDSSGNGLDATYRNISLAQAKSPFNTNVPAFNGTNSDVLNNSAPFRSAFDGDEGFIFGWFRVSDVDVWSDGNNHYLFSANYGFPNYAIYAYIEASPDNQITFRRNAGGQFDAVNHTTSQTDWFTAGISWSVAEDEFKVYIDGAQVGTTQTGLASITGSLDFFIGSDLGGNGWDGNVGLVPIWDTPITDAQDPRLSLMTR